ncbi:hypothetical protein KC669_01405 [Candidatus Dojkabacteria bacterium]|uniref:Uncharacterized protein n=1 Tax=Candidatus Dojkabacteria bacterium TaxID=2099670 RepID=A0A955LAN7_9BACT|nr:hypothetical protein [Candidatus Dojkabacteria bacterium]
MPTFKEIKDYLQNLDSLFILSHNEIREKIIEHFKLSGVECKLKTACGRQYRIDNLIYLAKGKIKKETDAN